MLSFRPMEAFHCLLSVTYTGHCRYLPPCLFRSLEDHTRRWFCRPRVELVHITSAHFPLARPHLHSYSWLQGRRGRREQHKFCGKISRPCYRTYQSIWHLCWHATSIQHSSCCYCYNISILVITHSVCRLCSMQRKICTPFGKLVGPQDTCT